jgi:hypothetical protein
LRRRPFERRGPGLRIAVLIARRFRARCDTSIAGTPATRNNLETRLGVVQGTSVNTGLKGNGRNVAQAYTAPRNARVADYAIEKIERRFAERDARALKRIPQIG